jgi:crotonobetainyl-CoA:carnitine CoA-transferase CaiB-like acyl-CoA transferase
MNVPLLQLLYGEKSFGRVGLKHPSIAPYGAYQCADRTSLICAVQNEREWRAFCELFLPADVARDPRFVDNSARVAHREVLDAMVADVFSKLSEEQASVRLEQTGIAYGRVNSISDAAVHPHLRTIRVDTPEGEIRVIAPAAETTEGPSPVGAVPALGNRTEAVRAEFSSSQD